MGAVVPAGDRSFADRVADLSLAVSLHRALEVDHGLPHRKSIHDR